MDDAHVKTVSDSENPEIGNSRQGFMKQSKLSKYAYAAGIIDGEGSISVSKCNHRKGAANPGYAITIDVAMKDGRVIDWLFGTFGGSVRQESNNPSCYRKSPDGRIYKNCTLYHWYIKCNKAAEVLKRVLPFLKLKKRQAELAIRLQSRINGAKSLKRNKGFRAGFAKHSKAEIAKREEIFLALKKENHVLHKSLALEAKRNGGRRVKMSSKNNSPTLKETNLRLVDQNPQS